MLSKIIWAIFGNDEDGPIGDARWNPERKDTLWIRIKWWVRNPFHNFTHHVIGIHGEPFASIKVYEQGNLQKHIRVMQRNGERREYPYWIYDNGRIEWYFGWRSSGAFGIAIRKRGGPPSTA